MGSENTEGFTMTALKITLDDGDMIITKFNGTAADYLRYCGGIDEAGHLIGKTTWRA